VQLAHALVQHGRHGLHQIRAGHAVLGKQGSNIEMGAAKG
jgi:hypothetical protein